MVSNQCCLLSNRFELSQTECYSSKVDFYVIKKNTDSHSNTFGFRLTQNLYWKERIFGMNAKRKLDKAIDTLTFQFRLWFYKGTRKPTQFPVFFEEHTTKLFISLFSTFATNRHSRFAERIKTKNSLNTLYNTIYMIKNAFMQRNWIKKRLTATRINGENGIAKIISDGFRP